MMIERISDPNYKKLKSYVLRLNIVMNELDVLEDFENVDYGDVATDIGYCTSMLEQRRES